MSMTWLNKFIITWFFCLCSQVYQFLMPSIIEAWLKGLFLLINYKGFIPLLSSKTCMISFFKYLKIDPFAVYPGKGYEI